MRKTSLKPKLPKAPNPLPEAAYIIGGGPSLRKFKWELLDERFTFGINRAYEVLPSADVVYFTDEDYYTKHIDDMLKHSGRLLKGCVNDKKYHSRVERVNIQAGKGISTKKGTIFHGRNSSFAAINILVQWGIKKIYLMGVDMKWHKGKSHWHSGHPRTDGEGALKGFMTPYKESVRMLKAAGVEVISLNNDTALTTFPIQKYEEHFGDNCFIK